ncbi:MAG: hypothetical protein ACP5F3_03990 [Candidatus Syntrophosphaera sp.]
MKNSLALCAVLLSIMILASSCASIKPVDKATLLRAELGKWENFSSDGIVELTNGGLTLRKMFVLSKTRDEARLDIVDGGVFGLNPNPLISLYLGDYAAIRSPNMPQLEALATLLPDPGKYLGSLGRPDSLFTAYGDQIIDTGKLVLGDTELAFSDNMRLEKISGKEAGIRMEISHTKRGDLDKVSIFIEDETSLDLLVDNIRYGKAELEPLPRNEALPGMEEMIRELQGLFPSLKGGKQ